MVWLMIVAILIVALALIALWPLRFRFSYTRIGDNDTIELALITKKNKTIYKLEVPFVDFSTKYLKPMLKFGSQAHGPKGVAKKEGDLTLDFSDWSWRFLRFIGHVIKQNLRPFKQAIYYLLRKTLIRDFRWSTEFSTGDAALTGVSSGILWTLKSQVWSWVRRHTKVSAKPVIQVQPSFNHSCLSLEIVCIGEVRIGHIIIATIKFIRCRLKRKRG